MNTIPKRPTEAAPHLAGDLHDATGGEPTRRARLDVTAPSKQPPVGGASDGTARGAKNAARQSGVPVADASSPMFVHGARDNTPVTVIVRASCESTTVARDIIRALEALEAEHEGAVRSLPTTQIGSPLLSTQAVYQVRPDLLPTLRAAAHGAKVEDLDTIISASRSRGRFSASTTRALKSERIADRAVAMLDLHHALKSNGAVPRDPKLRRELASAVNELIHPLTDLFNATMIEATRERREALLGTDPGLATYLGAAAQANAQLRANGGTRALAGIQRLVLRAAEVLDGLDTPYASALLSALVTQGDGIVFEQLAHRPETVKRLLDHTLDALATRFDETLELIAVNPRPEGVRGTSQGSGYRELTGGIASHNVYRIDPDHPFPKISNASLLFLGSKLAPDIRSAVAEAIVAADQRMPELIEKHRDAYVERELSRSARSIEAILSDAPEDHRAELREQLTADLRNEAIEAADADALTGQLDLDHLIYGLADLGLDNDVAFDAVRARTEVVQMFADLLPRLRAPTVHRLVADAALSALTQDESNAAVAADPGYVKAAANLAEILLEPGADLDVHLNAATRLAPIGVKAAVDPLVEALGHADGALRRAAVDTLAAMAIALVDPTKVLPPVAMAVERAPQDFTDALEGAYDGLKKRLDDPDGVWIQLQAGRALARFAPDAEVRAHAEALLSPEPAMVQFGVNNYGAKNAAVRSEAARVLGEMGAAGRSALPMLTRVASVGERAKALLARIDERRTAHVDRGVQSDYVVESDVKILAEVRAFLSTRIETSAARTLAFLNNPESPDLREVPSYERSRYPTIEAALQDLTQVGKAAAAARDKIMG